MKIAIQGFTGSFHAMAAEQYFGTDHELVMCENFPLLFKKLENKEADTAVMAIENTIAGTILFNYALLRKSNLKIIGETFLRIEHALLAYPNQTISDIVEVRSHPMALMQCMHFFSQYPHIKLVEDIDTAYMAELISKSKTKAVAAIANKSVALKFDLQVLKENIEDTPQNFTRFLILGQKSLEYSSKCNKATLAITLQHQIGVLSKVIQTMADLEMNITSLQSTPYVGNVWEYFFYFDIEFAEIDKYNILLEKLIPLTTQVLPLGTYAKGI